MKMTFSGLKVAVSVMKMANGRKWEFHGWRGLPAAKVRLYNMWVSSTSNATLGKIFVSLPFNCEKI